MKAGRKLDKLIAEKVMGLTNFYWLSGNLHYGPEYQYNVLPEYSTNIADAWLVVEKFKSKDYLFSLKNIVKGTFTFSLTDWGGKCSTYESEAETTPLAICLAALKAVGYEQ